MKLKYLFTLLGYFFYAGAIISFLVLSFIVTGTKGENFSRDLLGFPIPQAPEWTSFTPYLGMFISFIFESFSIHGVVQFGIMLGMIGVGTFLVNFNREPSQNSKPPITRSKDEAVLEEVMPGIFDNDHNFKADLDKLVKESNTISILGEEISAKNMPILFEWAQKNPETLEKQIKSVAKAWHEGDIRSAMIALESDLEHG